MEIVPHFKVNSKQEFNLKLQEWQLNAVFCIEFAFIKNCSPMGAKLLNLIVRGGCGKNQQRNSEIALRLRPQQNYC